MLYSISTPSTLVIGIKAFCTSDQRCLKTIPPGPTHTAGYKALRARLEACYTHTQLFECCSLQTECHGCVLSTTLSTAASVYFLIFPSTEYSRKPDHSPQKLTLSRNATHPGKRGILEPAHWLRKIQKKNPPPCPENPFFLEGGFRLERP